MSREEALIPIFPLSSIVLFPMLQVPLHVFEPRYRQLTDDALAGDRCIGMVGVLPNHAEQMSGDPPIFSVGCAGTIASSQQLPDGRYNIVLQATHRFRVIEEDPPAAARLYRRARVHWLMEDFDPEDAAAVANLRIRVVEQLDAVLRKLGREQPLPPDVFAELDDPTLVNTLANGFEFSPRDKQGLLEADGVKARFEQLAALFDFILAQANTARTSNSGALH